MERIKSMQENNNVLRIEGLVVHYPFISRLLGREGSVNVIFIIDSNGNVINWEIESSTGKEWENVVSKTIAASKIKIIGFQPDNLKVSQRIEFKLVKKDIISKSELIIVSVIFALLTIIITLKTWVLIH
jgi:TonB family protein